MPLLVPPSLQRIVRFVRVYKFYSLAITLFLVLYNCWWLHNKVQLVLIVFVSDSHLRKKNVVQKYFYRWRKLEMSDGLTWVGVVIEVFPSLDAIKCNTVPLLKSANVLDWDIKKSNWYLRFSEYRRTISDVSEICDIFFYFFLWGGGGHLSHCHGLGIMGKP